MNEIIIDAKALRFNVETIKKLAGSAKVCAVVKADAYGHGMIDIAKLLQEKVDYFAVSTLSEALKLKNNKISKNILILGYIEDFKTAINNGFEVTLGNAAQFKEFVKCCKSLNKIGKFHLKKDSGLNRYGYKKHSELNEIINLICENINFIDFVGFYTHLVITDQDCEKNIARQVFDFEKDVKILNSKNLYPIKHVASSTTLMLTKQYQFDMVRTGMALYGFCGYDNGLKKVMTVKSKIVEIKDVQMKDSIGYGAFKEIEHNKKIAVVPIGYGYGLDTKLSEKSNVLINEKRCKIIGQMSMDCMFVDVTKLKNVKIGDDVIYIGKQNEKEITATDHAKVLNTYSTEVISQINRNRFEIVIKD